MPVASRVGFLYLEHARLDIDNGALVALSSAGSTPIPAGALACLMLGPGTSVTHHAVDLLARLGCLALWVGEHGVRVYSAGSPGGASGQRILEQARCVIEPRLRLEATRRLYRLMMGSDAPQARSIDQLRGLEGSWVRAEYSRLARAHGILWNGRDHGSSDPINRAINIATSTLYGVTEAAILALGLSPAIGIVHTGGERSFVFDIADTVKFTTVMPLVFLVLAENAVLTDLPGEIRRRCRDLFFHERLLDRLVVIAEHVIFGDGLDNDNTHQS